VSEKGRILVEVEQLLLAERHRGGLLAIIAKASDFYGPGVVDKSWAGTLVFSRLKKKQTPQWAVNARVPRTYTYTPDIGRALYVLAQHSEAFHQTWILPVASPTLTGQEFSALAAKYMQGNGKVQVLPKWLFGLMGDFVYYPFTHSLVGELVASLLLGLAYWLLRRNVQSALLVGLLVSSHWLLDLVVHTPDLPLYPGPSPMFGFGLWNQVALTQVVEFALLGVGLWLYVRRTTARNGVGRYGLLGLVAFLVLIHVGGLFSPPPASVEALGWSGQLFWVIVLLAYWVDRNREMSGHPGGETLRPSVPAIS
jgi:hypothetical protein